jgi:hypothetical protein
VRLKNWQQFFNGEGSRHALRIEQGFLSHKKTSCFTRKQFCSAKDSLLSSYHRQCLTSLIHLKNKKMTNLACILINLMSYLEENGDE